jgi:hypothetical protein
MSARALLPGYPLIQSEKITLKSEAGSLHIIGIVDPGHMCRKVIILNL